MKNNIIEIPEGYELVKKNDNTYFIEKKKFSLEVGKDYILKDHNVIAIDRKSNKNNSGFINNVFSEEVDCSVPDKWREAAEEEVERAFEKELVRRYGENWESIQLEDNLAYGKCFGSYHRFNTGTYKVNICKISGGWVVWNKNGLLYYNGEWAGPELPVKWEDLKKVSGYYVASNSDVKEVGEVITKVENNINIFPSREEAEAALSLAQICQLRDSYNNFWKPDWTDEFEIKYCIKVVSDRVSRVNSTIDNTILAFKTRDLRDKFLENFEDLIIKARPLL